MRTATIVSRVLHAFDKYYDDEIVNIQVRLSDEPPLVMLESVQPIFEGGNLCAQTDDTIPKGKVWMSNDNLTFGTLALCNNTLHHS
jgi:hypothetical protein